VNKAGYTCRQCRICKRAANTAWYHRQA
jgi:hypothetical protein